MGRVWRGRIRNGSGGRGGRLLRRAAVVVAALLVVSVGAPATALRLAYAGDPSAAARTRGQDAIWLGHAWLDGRKSAADVTAFARRISGTGIRDLYVHAGPLENDGTLPAARYAGARQLLAEMRRALPDVRVHAWLGDTLDTEGPGMHLASAATRAAVVRSAGQILDAGFDGVHLDLEPAHSGDPDYLALVDGLHALTAARGALLSVSAPQIDPLPGLHAVAGTLAGHPKWWSQAYFAQVARRVDDIAVMSYDTALPLESLYGGYVAQQTELALDATPRGTGLLMGLPFYHEEKLGHHGYAETAAAAVRGVRLGLGRTDPHRARFGVALYVDFAARPSDWAAYRKGWCGTPA